MITSASRFAASRISDERRCEERLAMLDLGEDLLDVFELVGQLPAIAPDLFEAVRDVLDQLLGLELLVAPECRTPDLHMPQLNWCVPHASPP
jgi:hypothetical protein